VLACGSVVSRCAVGYFGTIAIGFGGIGESTRIVVPILDVPPRPPTALGIGGAVVPMYIAVEALMLGAWVANRVTRADARAPPHDGCMRSRREALGVALYAAWTSD
jgi:hypothetical protein